MGLHVELDANWVLYLFKGEVRPILLTPSSSADLELLNSDGIALVLELVRAETTVDIHIDSAGIRVIDDSDELFLESFFVVDQILKRWDEFYQTVAAFWEELVDQW